jgi:hypothetical protein
VCLRGKAEAPCVTTDESGAFTLTAPAHEEFALTAAATGYGSRVVALETVGRDVENWSVTLVTDAALRARHVAAGATYPDASTGYVFGLLVNVAPGEAEITFGPESVTCVPSYGGWPSKRPNSVRIPVVAGFETRVTMQCHR